MNKSSSMLHGYTKCCVCLLPFTTIHPISTKHLEACLIYKGLKEKEKKNKPNPDKCQNKKISSC